MSARDEQSWIEYEILAEKRINELSTELKSAVAARDMFAREVGTFMGEFTKLRENREEIKIQSDASLVALRSELANVKKELKEERKCTDTYIKLLHREQFERNLLADELSAYNDAIDAQPWATGEPIRVLLDRVTVALALGDKFRAELRVRDNSLEAALQDVRTSLGVCDPQILHAYIEGALTKSGTPIKEADTYIVPHSRTIHTHPDKGGAK